jgi:hypothetical protein
MNHKRTLSLVLALSFACTGCGVAEKASQTFQSLTASSESSSQVITGETVSGIITQVNGNEITLELVTMNSMGGGAPGSGSSGGASNGETPSGQEGMPGRGNADGGQNREFPSGGGSSAGDENKTPPSGSIPDGEPADIPSGEVPSAGTGEGTSPTDGGSGGITVGLETTPKTYTRTGETALYQIPVGTPVITLTGTTRDFNSLSTDLLVTITLREDGTTPAQVQVVQSLSS